MERAELEWRRSQSSRPQTTGSLFKFASIFIVEDTMNNMCYLRNPLTPLHYDTNAHGLTERNSAPKRLMEPAFAKDDQYTHL